MVRWSPPSSRAGCPSARPPTERTSSPGTREAPLSSAYPENAPDRDRWILERRPSRNPLDPRRAYAAFVEEEASESGGVEAVATVFLTNRECPWRCLMCDLWRNTLEGPVPRGAIAGQIRSALSGLPPARRIKLYNAGSFFDPNAIPPEDYEEIAAVLSPFERVVVESHPALVGPAALRFRGLLEGSLEVAMGLETVHPEVLPRLNKRMTLGQFRQAAERLRDGGIALRAFVLAGLPWVPPEENADWTVAAISLAFDCGATAVSLIPTRGGNGAMEALALRGEFALPELSLLETAFERGLALARGRVFADLWDLETFSRCDACLPDRTQRLRAMNLAQSMLSPVACRACGTNT